MRCHILQNKKSYIKPISRMLSKMTAFNKDEFNALLLSDFTKKGRSNSINLDNYLDVVDEVIQTYNLNNPDNQIEFNKESFKALLPKLSSAVIPELSTEINPLDVFKNSE